MPGRGNGACEGSEAGSGRGREAGVVSLASATGEGGAGAGPGLDPRAAGCPRGSRCVGGKALVRSVFQDIRLEVGLALASTMPQEEAEGEPRGLEPASAWVSAVHTSSCCSAPWVLSENPGLTGFVAPGDPRTNAFEGKTERETASRENETFEKRALNGGGRFSTSLSQPSLSGLTGIWGGGRGEQAQGALHPLVPRRGGGGTRAESRDSGRAALRPPLLLPLPPSLSPGSGRSWLFLGIGFRGDCPLLGLAFLHPPA